MKNYHKKITQGMFEAVKICLQSGNSVAQTAKFMKLSNDVVAMIRDAENLDEYRAAMYAKGQRRKEQVAAIKAKEAKKAEEPKEPEAPAQVVEHKTTVVVQATHYMESELKKHTELLTQISSKLAAIIDDLYGVKADAEQDH